MSFARHMIISNIIFLVVYALAFAVNDYSFSSTWMATFFIGYAGGILLASWRDILNFIKEKR